MQRCGQTCFTCPSCQAPLLSTDSIFQLKDLDKPAKCKGCSSSSKVGHWMCSCQLHWHLCTKHIDCCTSNTNSINSSSKQPLMLHNTGVKRIATQTFEQLQAVDDKRALKEIRRSMTKSSKHVTPAHSILPPQSNILSQKLRERFAHLLQK